MEKLVTLRRPALDPASSSGRADGRGGDEHSNVATAAAVQLTLKGGKAV